MLLFATCFFPIYVLRNSGQTVNAFQLGSASWFVGFAAPLFFALGIACVFLYKKYGNLLAMGSAILGVVAGMVANIPTDTNAETPEPYTTIAILLYIFAVPIMTVVVAILTFRRKKVVPEAVASTVPGEPVFFVVKTSKLIIMSVMTLGLYEIYWFYRNWRAVQLAEGSKIWPFARSLFGVLTSYFLFSRVAGIQALPLALLYASISVVGSRLPDWGMLAGFFSFVPLLFVQDGMVRTGHVQESNTYSLFETCYLIVASCIVVLAIVSAFSLPSNP